MSIAFCTIELGTASSAGMTGFEPATRGFGGRCSGRTELHPYEVELGAHGRQINDNAEPRVVDPRCSCHSRWLRLIVMSRPYHSRSVRVNPCPGWIPGEDHPTRASSACTPVSPRTLTEANQVMRSLPTSMIGASGASVIRA